VIRSLRRFREDERGAAAFLMVCGMVPLVLLVFFMVNTAKSINDKNRAQDAADAIALAHATETARALNTISMNQVTLTQTFATSLNASSLKCGHRSVCRKNCEGRSGSLRSIYGA